MASYASIIRTVTLIFPGVSLLLTLPFIIYNYRRYGSVSLLRSFVLFSFLFYLMCAYFLVILPLPDPAEVAMRHTPAMQLIPFTFIKTFIDVSPFRLNDPSTYLPALWSHAFVEPYFNLLLLLPFGAYLSYYFNNNLRKTILVTFLISMFFELTQLTGLYGIYPRPYRLFSVDDLVLNTFGGLLGYNLGLGIRQVLPSKLRLDERGYQSSQNVGYVRRVTADFVDLMLVFLLVALSVRFMSGPFLFPLVFTLYSVGLSVLTGGRTPGKTLVRIRVTASDSRLPFPVLLLIRYTLVMAPVWALEQAWQLLLQAEKSTLFAGIGLLILALIYLVSWITGFFIEKHLWYEILSRTRLESTFTLKTQGPVRKQAEHL